MKKYLIILFIMISSLCFAFQANHNVPSGFNSGQNTPLNLEILSGEGEIDYIQLLYRSTDELAYNSVMFTPRTNNSFQTDIPAYSSNTKNLEYYIIIHLKDGQLSYLPEVNPEANPYKLSAIITGDTVQDFIVLSPEEGGVSNAEEVVIAISYFNLEDEIMPNSLKLIVNGKDVTNKAVISSNMLYYRVPKLAQGKLNYQVKCQLMNGSEIVSPQFENKVLSTKRSNLPINLAGSLVFNSNWMHTVATNNVVIDSVNTVVSDHDISKDNNVAVTLNSNYKSIALDARAYVSSLDKKETQRINRYTIGLKTPFLDFSYGDNSPFFSLLSLNNKNVNGYYGTLHIPYIRLKSVYGETKRTVDGVRLDPLTLQTPGTFTQHTFGLRIELGKVDGLNFGFNLVKTKDDVKSLNVLDYKDIDTTTCLPKATPKDNLVTSGDMSLSMFHQRFSIGGEIALSMYNNNILDPALTKEELDKDYGIDVSQWPINPLEYSNILVLNKNIEPFIPGLGNMAFQSYMKMYVLNNFLNVTYQAVGPSYNSLTSSYLQKDAQTLTVSDYMNLFQGKCMLNGGISFISDNISSQKEYTNKNTNVFGQIFIRPRNLPYLRMGMNTNLSNNNADSLYNFNQQSNSYSVSVGHDLGKILWANTKVDISFNTLNNVDKTEKKAFDTLKHTLSFTLERNFEQLNINTVVGYTRSINEEKKVLLTSDEKTNYNSYSLRAESNLFEDRFIPYTSMRYSYLSGAVSEQSVQYYDLGANYQVFKNTLLSSGFGWKILRNESDESANSTYTNWNFMFSQKF